MQCRFIYRRMGPLQVKSMHVLFARPFLSSVIITVLTTSCLDFHYCSVAYGSQEASPGVHYDRIDLPSHVSPRPFRDRRLPSRSCRRSIRERAGAQPGAGTECLRRRRLRSISRQRRHRGEWTKPESRDTLLLEFCVS